MHEIPTNKTKGVILTNIAKLANKEICQDLANGINECIKKSEFSNEFKEGLGVISYISHIFKNKTDQQRKL